jgi:hypothetical protein
MSKARKYEGKQPVFRFGDPLNASSQICAVHRCSKGLFVSFILGTKGFSEMFTTYSHALLFLPRQRA